MTCRAVWSLRSLGVGPGDRFVMVVADDETFPAFFLGGLRMGAIPVPLSTMLRPAEVAAIASDAGATAIVASPAFASSVVDSLPSVVVDPVSWSGPSSWVPAV